MRYCLGDPTDYKELWFALGFMPFGLFFDFMDGKVARWRKRSSLMGQELDSLADLVLNNESILHDSMLIADPVKIADFIWRRSGRNRIRDRNPHSTRPRFPLVFCPLRPYAPRPIQRDGRNAPEG